MRVTIYENQGSGQEAIVKVTMAEDGTVSFEGNQEFITNLKGDGIRDYSSAAPSAKVYPEDGERFMKNLPIFFSSGHLSAVEEKEEED